MKERDKTGCRKWTNDFNTPVSRKLF